MGPNILKINIMMFDCSDCKKEIKVIGKDKDECLDKGIRHFYDHDYPAWRQPSSIKKDMPYEEYKRRLLIALHEEDK